MRKTLLIAALAGLTFAPAIGFAQDVVIVPEVDTWVVKQKADPGISIDADISIGSSLPDTVTVVDVPDHDDYSYTVVNKKRVLVQRKTRKVVKVYE